MHSIEVSKIANVIIYIFSKIDDLLIKDYMIS